jgi:hypothetical protein
MRELFKTILLLISVLFSLGAALSTHGINQAFADPCSVTTKKCY